MRRCTLRATGRDKEHHSCSVGGFAKYLTAEKGIDVAAQQSEKTNRSYLPNSTKHPEKLLTCAYQT
jgi:hypothetical protein